MLARLDLRGVVGDAGSLVALTLIWAVGGLNRPVDWEEISQKIFIPEDTQIDCNTNIM